MGVVGLDHVALPVRDPVAMMTFYGALGFELPDEAAWRRAENPRLTVAWGVGGVAIGAILPRRPAAAVTPGATPADPAADVTLCRMGPSAAGRVLSVWRLPRRERYAAAVLLGNTVGLVGTVERVPRLLRKLAGVADLVALDSGDRPPTPTRFRLEYGGQAGGWLSWVHVPPAALAAAAAGAGYSVEFVRAPGEPDRYGALLVAGTTATPSAGTGAAARRRAGRSDAAPGGPSEHRVVP